MKIIFHKCKTNSYKYKYFDYYLFSLNFHAKKKQNLKMILYLYLMTFSFKLSFIISDTKSTCVFESSKYTKNLTTNDEKIFLTRNFNSFNELNFSACNQIIEMSNWYINPNEKLILDDKLDFYVMPNNQLLRIKLSNHIYILYIQLLRIKGFDYRLTFSPFRYIQFLITYEDFSTLAWLINESYFDFYIGDEIIDQNNCNQSLLNNYNYFLQIQFLCLQKNVKFQTQICPYLFEKVIFDGFLIFELSKSLLSKNLLQFNSLPIEQDLKSEINHFEVYGYQIDLNEKLLNKYVFKRMYVFSFYGQINSIEEGVFKDFNQMFGITFQVEFISSVFHSKIKWLYSLTQKPLIDPTNFMPSIDDSNFIAILFQQSLPKLILYEFPDEDICIFEKFPHKHAVLPMFYPTSMSKCSCSFIFLVQYSYKYSDFFETNLVFIQMEYFYSNSVVPNRSIIYNCVNDSIEETIILCNFTERFKKCNIKQEQRNELFDLNMGYFYMNDLLYDVKSMNIIINFYILPILCSFCILVNFIIFLVCRKEKLKDKFYQYLKITYSFNSILCFIIPFQLFSFCIYPNGNYCSSFYKSIYSQYFNIFYTKLIGNTIKTCSYWSNVSFTLSRFLKISSYQEKCLNKMDKISIKKYIFFCFFLSFLINLSSVFELSPHEFSLLKKAKVYDFYQYPFYSASKYFSNDYLKQRETVASITLYTFHIIKIIFSDILFLVFNFIIDVKLYLFLKKSDLKKLELTKATKKDHLTYKQQKLEVAKNRLSKVSKNKIKATIYFNFFNFFILKFPLILFSLLHFIFSYDEKVLQNPDENKSSRLFITLCSFYKICESFSSLSLMFLLLSFLFQFYILIKLDRNFSYEIIKATIRSLFIK